MDYLISINAGRPIIRVSDNFPVFKDMSTLHGRNLKTQQSTVNFDLRLRKTQAGLGES